MEDTTKNMWTLCKICKETQTLDEDGICIDCEDQLDDNYNKLVEEGKKINEFLKPYQNTPYYVDIAKAIEFGSSLK